MAAKIVFSFGKTARRQKTDDRRLETGDRRQHIEVALPGAE
jgi:hypothetical protein